ncbi:hypothetical protein EVAR_101349_1 [Eumeta japonica]|uniref:Uncharacterized protein n=1 Tax=Eumeta variegata TaxID=151549 RepID=A0A4C1SJJ3_EUMVA|nr:hypothetical protein EVAR_101349_1 [Eumeta japonica]
MAVRYDMAWLAKESQPSQQQMTQKQQQHQQEHPLMDKENQPIAEKLPITTNSSQNSTAINDDESLHQQRHSSLNSKAVNDIMMISRNVIAPVLVLCLKRIQTVVEPCHIKIPQIQI